jgi:hypothetical protein
MAITMSGFLPTNTWRTAGLRVLKYFRPPPPPPSELGSFPGALGGGGEELGDARYG